MQSTRARIIELLRAAGDATVEDITNGLALAPATVRRHLDVLLRDGLVEMRSERLPLGRPHFVFSLTDLGLEALPARQMYLVGAVLETILALTPVDTRGKDGMQVAVLVFDRLTERLVQQFRPVVTASELDRRVEQAVEVLATAGLEFEVAYREDGFVIRGGGCLCERLLSSGGGCSHEAGLLGGLIGAPVRRIEASEAGGARRYLVQARTAGVL